MAKQFKIKRKQQVGLITMCSSREKKKSPVETRTKSVENGEKV